MHHNLTILLLACVIEAAFSYPEIIYKYIRHPVVWMGSLIAFLDKYCNITRYAKIMGIVSVIILLAATLTVSIFIKYYGNLLIEIIVVSALLAIRSLYDHVNEVYKALLANDLVLSREKLAKIVWRDVDNLDESEISKAAIETLAESFNDGVVAPIFWAALFGIPGIACYKAINTADSMIGHKTERYKDFGWAAARLDDVMNYIPARISALLIVAYNPMNIKLTMLWKEAKKHASPNSGYPEAAMSAIIGVCLGGRRIYDGEEYNAPLIGTGMRLEINRDDVSKSLQVYVTVCQFMWLVLLMITILL